MAAPQAAHVVHPRRCEVEADPVDKREEDLAVGRDTFDARLGEGGVLVGRSGRGSGRGRPWPAGAGRGLAGAGRGGKWRAVAHCSPVHQAQSEYKKLVC